MRKEGKVRIQVSFAPVLVFLLMVAELFALADALGVWVEVGTGFELHFVMSLL